MIRFMIVLGSLISIAAATSSGLYQQNSPSGKPMEDATASLEKKIRTAQTSVVQINLQISGKPSAISDPELREAFGGGYKLTIGSGFIVNDHGDIVTADHVLSEVNAKIIKLNAEGIKSYSTIGISQRNQELYDDRGNSVGSFSGNAYTGPYSIKGEDPTHDVAVVTPEGDIFAPPLPVNGGPGISFAGLKSTRSRPAVIDVSRPSDGADIFSCGYPLGSDSFVATSGHIASAWSSRVLIYANQKGIEDKSDVYTLDLRVDLGDSGAPVFSSENQSVVGMIVEHRGSLGIAIASKYISAVLDKNHIPWTRKTP